MLLFFHASRARLPGGGLPWKRFHGSTQVALFVIVVLISVPVEAQYGGFLAVIDSMLQNLDPADWLMRRRTLNSWGYSPLNQINRSNVG